MHANVDVLLRRGNCFRLCGVRPEAEGTLSVASQYFKENSVGNRSDTVILFRIPPNTRWNATLFGASMNAEQIYIMHGTGHLFGLGLARSRSDVDTVLVCVCVCVASYKRSVQFIPHPNR